MTKVTANVTSGDFVEGRNYWLSPSRDAKEMALSTTSRFYDSRCQRSNFSSAQFQLCDFEESDFSGSDFRNAVLKQCSARKARFVQVDFTGAALDDCDFSNADFTQSKLAGIKSCSHSKFNHSAGLTGEQFRVLLAHGAEPPAATDLPVLTP